MTMKVSKVMYLTMKLKACSSRKKCVIKDYTYKFKYTEDDHFYQLFYNNKSVGKFNKLNNELKLKEFIVDTYYDAVWPNLVIKLKKRELAGWQLRKCYNQNIFDYTKPVNFDIDGVTLLNFSLEFMSKKEDYTRTVNDLLEQMD